MSDAVDTVQVTGGRPLASVDAGAVRVAATHASRAADELRAAALRTGCAALAFESEAWTAAGSGGLGAGPGDAALGRALAGQARDLAHRLGGDADACSRLAMRLLRAAGLYEHGESAAERAVGALVTVVGAEVGFRLAAPLAMRPGSGLWAAGAAGAVWLADRASGGWVRRWFSAARSAGEGLLAHHAASLADEAVAGVGLGVAAAQPVRSGGDLSVTGGARALSALLRELVRRTPATVDEVRPRDAAAWPEAPSGSIDEALTRVDALTGGPAGLPEGTLGLERVTHDDGSVTWTVLIPGTQQLASATDPFDGVTDLDLMAHQAADVSAGVEQALDDAGARPGERVVLVGHSLGGIAAMALAATPSFTARHPVGAVVTAGSPTATFTSPAGVPVLNLENEEELVSATDGRPAARNPRSPDRVTVTRRLRASSDPVDRRATASIPAHSVPTHLRTLALARASGSAQVDDVVGRIEPLLQGGSAQTRFYAVRTAPAEVSGAASARRPR